MITAREYSQLFKNNHKNMSSLEQQIFLTLNHHQVQIIELKNQTNKDDGKIRESGISNNSNYSHGSHGSHVIEPLQPYDQDEAIYARGVTFKEHAEELGQLAEVIDWKIHQEQLEQQQFIRNMKEQYENEEKNQ